MATEDANQAVKTPQAPASPTNNGHTLAPEELAEFMASLEFDETPAAPEDCADYDAGYND
jgi:hypothetical protein